MKKNEFNIDKLISTKLENHNINPPEDSWNNISSRISNNKTRKLFPVFMKIAAGITLLFAISSIFIIQNNLDNEIAKEEALIQDKNNKIEQSEQKITEQYLIAETQNLITNNQENENINSENTISIKKNIDNTTVPNVSKTVNNKELLIQETNNPKQEVTEPKSQISEAIDNFSKLNTKEINNLKEFIAKKNLQNTDLPKKNNSEAFEFIPEKKKSNIKNWSISGQFAPSYSFRNLKSNKSNSEQNAIIDNYNFDETDQAIMSYAGGLNIEYQINKKLSIQSGLNYSRIGHSSEEIILSKSSGSQNDISISSSIGKVSTFERSGQVLESIEMTRSSSSLSSNSEMDKATFFIKNNLVYRFDYLELPLIMKYKLIDKKIDFQILGGLNSGILIDNNVYVKTDNELNKIGKTDDLRTINYSGILGFGIEYLLFKRTTFVFEPSLKYSLLPINNSNQSFDYYAYSFSLFTGIKYTIK